MQVLEIGVRLGLEDRTDGFEFRIKNPGNMSGTMEVTLRMGGGHQMWVGVESHEIVHTQ